MFNIRLFAHLVRSCPDLRGVEQNADGGYVLISLNAPQPELFENIIRGGGQVPADIKQRAADANMEIELPDQQ